MNKLSKPSRELGAKILSKVSFENRFIGFLLQEQHGAVHLNSYSFEEVINLLNAPMPRVDFDDLEIWVKEVIGDDELAERIAKVVEKESSDHARTICCRNLMYERLTQCKNMT